MRSIWLSWLLLVPAVATAQSFHQYFYDEDVAAGSSFRGAKSMVEPVTANVYSFDYDATHGDLRWCVNGYNCQTLDGAGGTGGRTNGTMNGRCIEAVAYNNAPHVFYVEQLATGYEVLHHAWQPGGLGFPWAFEVIDGPSVSNGVSAGGCPSASTFSNTLVVAYYEGTFGDLRVASTVGLGWALNTLDGSGGTDGRVYSDVGKFSSMLDLGSALEIFYTGSGKLRAAYCPLTGICTFRDHDTGSVADEKVKAVLNGGIPHVFYTSAANGTTQLKHSWRVQVFRKWFWSFEAIDANGVDVDAAIMNGNVHVVYYDAANGNLRHAFGSGSPPLTFETADGDGGAAGQVSGDVGRSPSILFNYPWLQVRYDDTTHARTRQAYTY
jgi:hypothetical protein